MIEERLSTLIPAKADILSKAMRYALLGPGKRIRPLLTIAASETLGAKKEAALEPACALEMVHAYSLIHDDLPCMDNDDFRRGRPTVHRAFSESIAILAGDALLTEAFRVLASSPKLKKSQIVRLVALLALHSGAKGMIGGQIIDIQSTNQSLSKKRLIEMHQKKTGALLTCSLEFGAIIANATLKQEESLRFIGKHLGLAYQIQDDLSDALQSNEKGKPNALVLLGKNKAKVLLNHSLKAIENELKRLPDKGRPIKAIISSIF